MNVCALIPSYNPDERLVSTAEDLRACGFRHIIAVDDGSRPDCQPYFQALEQMDCKVVRLPQNSGKGEALKLGFLAFLTQGWADAGVVTVDGDGQHSGRDALRCAAPESPGADSGGPGFLRLPGAGQEQKRKPDHDISIEPAVRNPPAGHPDRTEGHPRLLPGGLLRHLRRPL